MMERQERDGVGGEGERVGGEGRGLSGGDREMGGVGSGGRVADWEQESISTSLSSSFVTCRPHFLSPAPLCCEGENRAVLALVVVSWGSCIFTVLEP